MTAPDPDAGRARFAAATEAHLTAPLADGVILRHVDHDELTRQLDELWRDGPRPGARLERVISDDERARSGDLNAVLGTPLSHRILLEASGAVIGAYWGAQEDAGRYYMVNSIVRQDHRGHGLYARLLARVVLAARDAGFHVIYSRHRATNNAVLVPKLRAGFLIAGFEVAPRHGVLVHLRKYLQDGAARAFEYRIDGAHGEALRASGFID